MLRAAILATSQEPSLIFGKRRRVVASIELLPASGMLPWGSRQRMVDGTRPVHGWSPVPGRVLFHANGLSIQLAAESLKRFD